MFLALSFSLSELLSKQFHVVSHNFWQLRGWIDEFTENPSCGLNDSSFY